ncbi:hypothetical protein IV53_GL000782 [Ligilactobacillus ceti DSM 22408]|uniref:Uncharacterized protein n=2 Tax=Ligilactobacillus TaxID=2767887 RepID=A0A0R2KPE8_9LACO|nr:hypothetical protein IV53_GL000782 [Ligilactobacillus ceti DSM 22408]
MALIMGIGCMIITMYLKIKKDYLLKLVIDDKITNFDFLFYANIALWIAIPCFVAAFVIPLLRMIRDTLMGGIS